MLYKLRVRTLILLLLIVFTSSCERLNAIPSASTLFLVDATGRLEYRFTLFDVENKNLIIQNVDFSTTNWDVTLGSSRFSTQNGSESIHYNPVTEEIIFVLFPGPYGEGNWKPADALPDPPFHFAIYKSSFESQNQFTPLYIETSLKFYIDHIVLNSHTNSLFMDINTYGEAHHPEILKFDIGTRQFEYIANTETKFFGKDLVERSDLRLSPDGRKLYQLVLYGNPKKWTNETLYLKTINLDDRSVNYQEIITGGNLQYDILAISADGSNVAFYTMDTENWHLWVKNIDSGKTMSIPIDGEMGNTQLFMTDDGKKILVGLRDGSLEVVRYYWEIYDLSSNEYQATPLNRPLAWDTSGRYLVGIKDNSYIIYDIVTLSESEIGLSLPTGYNQFHVQCVQWH